MIKLRKLFTAVLSICLLLSIFPSITTKAVESEPVSIPCSAYILIDLDNGRVLAEKNADSKIYPASTTKIMTGILALERSPLDMMMTASLNAVNDIGDGGMNIGIMEGEQIRFSDLIQAVLLHSANEAANIVAENSASSREEFLSLMNKKAKEIGATHTRYKNFHGMPDTEHYTTARDLAKIARYAMVLSPASEKFRNVVNKPSFTLPPTNKHSVWYGLKVTNKLRDYDSNYFNEVIGVKTGYIDASGHNFISCVSAPNGKRLLSVVSGIRTFDSYNNIFYYTRNLLDYGYKNNSIQQYAKKGSIIAEVDVANEPGGENKVNAILKKNLNAFLPKDVGDWDIEQKITLTDTDFKAPLKAGTNLGKVSYYINGHYLSSDSLISEKDIPINFGNIRSIIINYYMFSVLLICILIYLFSRRLRKKRKIVKE